MKLRSKIITGYFVIAGLAAMVALLGIWGLHKIDQTFKEVVDETLPLQTVLQELKLSSSEVLFLTKGVLLRDSFKGHVRSSDVAALTNDNSDMVDARLRLTGSLEAYRKLVFGVFDHEEGMLESVEQAVGRFLNASTAARLSLIEGGVDLAKLQRRLDVAGYVLDYRINEVIEHENQELEERTAMVQASIVDSERIISLALVAAIFLAVSGGLLAGRAIAGPIEALKEAVGRVATGDWGFKLEIKNRDELGELARAFNSMSVEIESSQLALTEMRDYSESVLRTMTNALVVVREDGSLVSANETLLKLSGLDMADLEAHSIEDVLDIDWPGLVADLGQDTSFLEITLKHRDGRLIPVVFSMTEHEVVSQGEREFICVAQDISELRTAEANIAGTKRFLESVLNSMTDEICIVDPHDFRILGINKAFADVYGLDPEAPVDITCHKLTHGIDEPCSGDEDPCPIFAIREHGKSLSCEHVHLCPDGSTKHVEIQGCPVFNENGEVVQVVHAARDITEKKEAQQMLDAFSRQMESNNRALVAQTVELEDAHAELKSSQSRILQQEKMASIGQLAAGVAHEINNPMGFIISNLGSLQKYSSRLIDFIKLQEDELSRISASGQMPDNLVEQRKKMKIDYLCNDLPDLVEESLGGADRVKKIVQDLKSFSRVDQKEFKQIDLNECIESTITIIWNELKYKVELFREFGDLPRIGCFPQQLNQVFMNILVNAAQAMEDRGEIHVKTWQEDGTVQVSITDNGCGIPEEVQSRIFEPFFTTKDVGKGTGLGMSIVFDIIKKHKGEIRLDSELGKGTRFTIVLPNDLTEESVAVQGEPEMLATA